MNQKLNILKGLFLGINIIYALILNIIAIYCLWNFPSPEIFIFVTIVLLHSFILFDLLELPTFIEIIDR